MQNCFLLKPCGPILRERDLYLRLKNIRREKEDLAACRSVQVRGAEFFKQGRVDILSSNRLVVAAAVLPFVALYIYFLPPFPYFLALLVVVCMLAMREFFIMYRVPRILYVPGILIGGVLFYMFCRHPAYFFDGIFVALFFLLLARLVAVKTPSGRITGASGSNISGALCKVYRITDGSSGEPDVTSGTVYYEPLTDDDGNWVTVWVYQLVTGDVAGDIMVLTERTKEGVRYVVVETCP